MILFKVLDSVVYHITLLRISVKRMNERKQEAWTMYCVQNISSARILVLTT
jgi:hypothetical protein